MVGADVAVDEEGGAVLERESNLRSYIANPDGGRTVPETVATSGGTRTRSAFVTVPAASTDTPVLSA